MSDEFYVLYEYLDHDNNWRAGIDGVFFSLEQATARGVGCLAAERATTLRHNERVSAAAAQRGTEAYYRDIREDEIRNIRVVQLVSRIQPDSVEVMEAARKEIAERDDKERRLQEERECSTAEAVARKREELISRLVADGYVVLTEKRG